MGAAVQDEAPASRTHPDCVAALCGTHPCGKTGPCYIDSSNPRIQKARQEAEAVEAVLDDWRAATGRKRNFQPVDRSWKKTRDALRYGFTRNHLRLAVVGALLNPWNQGENPSGTKYLNPENIFTNSEAVDRHIHTARAKLKPEDWWPAPEDGEQQPAPFSVSVYPKGREPMKAEMVRTPAGPSIFEQFDRLFREREAR